jgi:hypothetical protein
LAVVVEDEDGVEVARPDQSASIPGIAAFGIFQIAVGPIDGLVADLVAAESLGLLLVSLVFTSVRVVRDDEDSVMLRRRRAVGREGERSVLEAKFLSRGRVRSDLSEGSRVE